MKKIKLEVDKNSIIKLFQEKKFNKISKLSKQILKKNENEVDLWKIVIVSEISMRNYFSAEKKIKKLLLLKDDSEINYLHGNVLKLQNKNLEAIEAFKKAIRQKKNFSQAYNNLGNVYKKIYKIENAIENYHLAIKYDEKNLEAYNNLGNILKQEKHFEESIYYFKKLTDLDPNFPDAYNNIGANFSILGKIDEAEKYFKIAISKNQLHGESYKNYVLIKKIKKDDKIFKNLEIIAKRNDLTNDQKQNIFFSLSKSYFDLADNDKAFDFLEKANDLKSESVEYSHRKHRDYFNSIIEFFKKFSNEQITTENNYKSYPIFIMGMPRSGTSLIEQIISNHSQVYGGGELDILPQILDRIKLSEAQDYKFIFQDIRDQYLNSLNKLSEKKYITDKLPGNFKSIGFIKLAIPEAKIIQMERNPMAVCWSNYKANFSNNGMGFTHNQKNLANFFILYKNLINFWKLRFPDGFTTINYEEFVSDHENKIVELFKILGLEWEDHLFEFQKNDRPVETASFLQVRKKIYKDSSNEWKKFRKYLQPMIKIFENENINF